MLFALTLQSIASLGVVEKSKVNTLFKNKQKQHNYEEE